MAATEPTLSAFITRDHHAIIDEFTSFARTLVPPDSPMTEQELRDHSKELLQAIALDLETQQTNHEQAQKSKGLGAAHMMRASGRLHADARELVRTIRNHVRSTPASIAVPGVGTGMAG